LGEVIRYDTVGLLKWGVSLSTHAIKVVIEQVLGVEWKGDGDDGTDEEDTGFVPNPKKAADVEGVDGVCVVSRYSAFIPDFDRLMASTIGLFQLGVWGI
jgi:hypothetical protein